MLAPVVQSLGWIRWPLVVPGLAERYLDPTASAATVDATAATYELINAYAGGALGENLGWLLQGVWAVGLAILAWRAADVAPTWLRRTLAVVAVAWTVTLVPAGWLASDALTALGSTVYSLWYLALLVLGATLLRPRRTPAPSPLTRAHRRARRSGPSSVALLTDESAAATSSAAGAGAAASTVAGWIPSRPSRLRSPDA